MMPWAAAIAAVGTIGGAAIQSDASRKAANQQTEAAKEASRVQWDIYQQQRQDQQPWMRTGSQATNVLAYQMGLPGYGASFVDPNRLARGTPPARTGPYSGAEQVFPQGEVYPQGAEGEQMVKAQGGLSGLLKRAYDPKDSWRDNDFVRFGNALAMFPQQNFKDYRDKNRSDPKTAGGDGRSIDDPYANGGDQIALPSAGFGSLQRDFSLEDFQEDPGYQFRLQQGEQAINRNALARGRHNSGSVLKALQDFNSGLASQEFGNSYNRYRANQGDRFNRLASLAGIGQTSVGQVSQAGSLYGQQAGNNALAAGNAAAAGTVGQANAWNGAIGQGVNWFQGQNALRGQNNNRQGFRSGSSPTYNNQPWGGTAEDPWYG